MWWVVLDGGGGVGKLDQFDKFLIMCRTTVQGFLSRHSLVVFLSVT